MHEQGSRRVNGRMGSSVFCTDYLLLQETIIPIRKYDRSILILNKTFMMITGFDAHISIHHFVKVDLKSRISL